MAPPSERALGFAKDCIELMIKMDDIPNTTPNWSRQEDFDLQSIAITSTFFKDLSFLYESRGGSL